MTALTAAPPASFDHGLRGRFNAWFFTTFDRYINWITAPLKQAAFGGLAAGTIVELGSGTGANLAYLPRGAELVAVEPNLRMHPLLAARCADAGIELRLLAGGAEEIPLPDASVDDVICSLVLCTVADQDAVLREVRRVLRPGGRLRFVEHVAAEPRSTRSGVQRCVRRPWGWIFEGCDPHRDTAAALARAGFTTVSLTRQRLHGSVFYPVNTTICGVAVR